MISFLFIFSMNEFTYAHVISHWLNLCLYNSRKKKRNKRNVLQINERTVHCYVERVVLQLLAELKYGMHAVNSMIGTRMTIHWITTSKLRIVL